MIQSWCRMTPIAAIAMPPHQQIADTTPALRGPDALEPAAPQRRGRSEEDEEQRVDPAEVATRQSQVVVTSARASVRSAQTTGCVTPSARDSGSQNTLKPYAIPMQRWMASAAGGTSQRLNPGAAMMRSRSRSPAKRTRRLLPRHHRHVNGAGRAFAADRLDRVVHLRQPEPVRRHQLERKALRRELRAARAPRRDTNGRARSSASSPSASAGRSESRETSRCPLPAPPSSPPRRLVASIPSSIGVVPPPLVQSTTTSTPRPPVISMMRASAILFRDVDHVIGAKQLRHLEPPRILRRAGDDDAGGAGLLGGHGAAEALLSWTLDEHRRGVADAAVHERPLDAVGHRRGDAGQLGREAVGHAVEHDVERQVDVVAEAAPERRARCRSRCIRIGWPSDRRTTRWRRSGGTRPCGPTRSGRTGR